MIGNVTSNILPVIHSNLLSQIMRSVLSILVSATVIFSSLCFLDAVSYDMNVKNAESNSVLINESRSLPLWTQFAEAKAKDEYAQRNPDAYYHMDPSNLFDANGSSSEDNITPHAIKIIKFIVTAILLPIGILFSIWRFIYIAIFIVMMGKDPLDFSKNPRYAKAANKGNVTSDAQRTALFNTRANMWGRFTDTKFEHRTNSESISANYGDYLSDIDKQTSGKNMLLQELKFTLVALVITLVVWQLLLLVLTASVAFLNFADTVSTQANKK